MKNIPTMYKKAHIGARLIGIPPELVDPSFQWVLDGEGTATIKFDGACCAIIDGELYKRFDSIILADGTRKEPPPGAIPCQPEPDKRTGHWPHWLKVGDGKRDRWFRSAKIETFIYQHAGVLNDDGTYDGTYEAIGKHFKDNPYNLEKDFLVRHGSKVIDDLFGGPGKPRTFDSIFRVLAASGIEGIVFWRDGEPQCKIKRVDVGLPWPITRLNFDTLMWQ